jgi:hypothetical protein
MPLTEFIVFQSIPGKDQHYPASIHRRTDSLLNSPYKKNNVKMVRYGAVEQVQVVRYGAVEMDDNAQNIS